MPNRVTRVGSLDIQFNQNWEMAKGNQLVQSLQQTISAVNSAWVAIAALQAGGGGGGGNVTAPVQIADGSGIGPQVAVGPGLSPGDVLIAISGTDAAFGQLQFGEMAQTDSASFNAPAEGDVIMFHTGFWTAMPDPNTGLGLADPGQNALVMWDETAAAFAWAIPVAGGGIKLVAGAISIDDSQIDHAKLEGLHFTVASGGTLVANDHPQYAMLAGANTWTALQTFNAGLVSNADITLNGNLEQAGPEPEWRIVNTDDIANEGAWRIHAEPGQFIISSVSDDGADGENWLCATRIGEIVDAVNVSSNSFTWNGAQVLTDTYVPPKQSNPTFISPITVPQGITLTGVEPFFTIGDTQSAPNEGYWQLHAEPGMLIWSTLYDDGISWGENWLTVTRSDELVDAASINFQGGALRFNGDDVWTSSSVAPGANVYFSINAAGQTVINAATGSGSGAWTITDGTNTVTGVTHLAVTGGTVGGATPNATLTISATATPAAPTTSVQFNNAGAFGGSANLTWNGTFLQSKSDGIGIEIQSLTSAGFSYQRMNDQAGTRQLEFLFIGSAGTPVYGGAVGDSVMNVNAGTLWLSTGDTGRISINHTGAVVIAAPGTAASALTTNGAAGAYTLDIVGSASSGNSYGLLVQAGTTSADLPVQVQNKAGSAQFLLLFGDGHGTLGPSATSGMQWAAAGNFNFSAPASGPTATFNAVAPSGANDRGLVLTNTGAGDSRFAISTSTAGDAQLNLDTFGVQNWVLGNKRSDGSLRFSASQTLGTGDILTMLSTGASTFSGPVTATGTLALSGIQGNGANGNFAIEALGSASTGNSFGLVIVAGTTSADQAFVLLNRAETLAFINIFGDGHGTIGPGVAGLSWTAGGSFSVAATTTAAATTLTVNGIANGNTVVIIGSATANQSFGLDIQAGTSSSDYCMFLQSHAGTTLMEVFGNGGVTIGTPTGGDKGAGTLNVSSNLFVNNVAVAIGTTFGVLFNATATPSVVQSVRAGSPTVTRTGPGLYTVTWAPGINPTAVSATLIPGTASGIVEVTSWSGLNISVVTTTLAGSITDFGGQVSIMAVA